MRTIFDLITMANQVADESLDEDIVFEFINQGLADASEELNCLFPPVDPQDVDKEYRVVPEMVYVDANKPTKEETIRNGQLNAINNMFETLLIDFAAFKIKVNDGSEYEWRQFEDKYKRKVRSFNSKYRKTLDERFKTEHFVLDDGSTIPNGFGVSVIEREHSESVSLSGHFIVDSGKPYGGN